MDFFQLANTDAIESPALVVDAQLVNDNIAKMIAMVDGDAGRLRPHVKTHKMPHVIALQLDAGITKFKTATLSEAEMVANAGGVDILIAHPLVGPKLSRLHELTIQHPDVRFSAIVDCIDIAHQMSDVFTGSRQTLDVYVDIDCGMHRTGIPLGDTCESLIQKIDFLEGVSFAGLHVYDGHLHQPALGERTSAAKQIIAAVRKFALHYPDADIVGGGSPTFAIWAGETDWDCSPGTPIFWDVGYGQAYPDLDFKIAAALLTRVVSKPGDSQICLDIGHKSISSEMPLEQRLVLPELADAKLVSHSEEHLVVRTLNAPDISVGDAFLAFPRHICPTVADHASANVVRWGNVTDERWPVTARDR